MQAVLNQQQRTHSPHPLGTFWWHQTLPSSLNALKSCCCRPPVLLLQALIDSVSAPDALAGEHAVRSIAFFDHEEVGSDSAQGAGGPVMRDTITRVARVLSKVGEERVLLRHRQRA